MTQNASAVTSRFVDHSDATIHYLDCRPELGAAADAAPIVFVPGMTDIADDYRSIAEHTGRRTLVVELRGHGRSRASSGWTIDHHARDIDAVVADTIDGPLHLMTFSRGTCYALRWCADHGDRVRSLTIGDYPAREIALPADVATRLFDGRWRGTPVADRVDRTGFESTVAASLDRPLWDIVEQVDAPMAVVRSSATTPINDDDWQRYGEASAELTRLRYVDSPHDIFRRDRTRFPRLAAEMAAAGDRRASAPESIGDRR